MPIISKETWDKLSQEEKTIIQNRYRYYNDNNDSRYNREIEIYDEFFGKENLRPLPLTYEDVAREDLKFELTAEEVVIVDGSLEYYLRYLKSCEDYCKDIHDAKTKIYTDRIKKTDNLLTRIKQWQDENNRT